MNKKIVITMKLKSNTTEKLGLVRNRNKFQFTIIVQGHELKPHKEIIPKYSVQKFDSVNEETKLKLLMFREENFY